MPPDSQGVYVVTLTCGCTWETTDPPSLGDLLPCPQRDTYRVVWVRRMADGDEWEELNE